MTGWGVHAADRFVLGPEPARWQTDLLRRCRAAGFPVVTAKAVPGAAPVQVLCGTFTPTAAISFSKLTKFSTRLHVDEARYGAAKAHLRL